MNGIAYGPGLRLRAVASSNGATTCLAPRGQGLFHLRTSTPSPLRSLTGPKWSQHCLDPRCEQFLLDAIAAPVHASPPETVSSGTQELLNLLIRRRPELSILYALFGSRRGTHASTTYALILDPFVSA